MRLQYNIWKIITKSKITPILIFLTIWELIIFFIKPNSPFVSSPSEIIQNIGEAISEGFLLHMLITTIRTLIGFIFASIIGIIFGILIGKIKYIKNILSPFIDFLRPLPSSAIILTVVIIITNTELAFLFIITFGAIWPIIINTISGVENVNINATKSINQLKLNKYKYLLKFLLPEAAPEIFAGLKISLSICLILAITAELVGGGTNYGIGYYLLRIETGGNYSLHYACIVSISILGFTLNRLLNIVELKHPWLKTN